VPEPLLARARAARLLALQTYGLTEACSQVTTERPAEADGRSAGPALPGIEVRITGPGGEVLGAGREGDIEVRGPTVMAGYLNRPEATHEALREGWLHTQDLGTLDGRGRLTVLSRRTDLIVRGGENLYPVEIETVLAAHPAVQEVAVAGLEDARWGEVPVAFVVLRPGHALPEELDGWCRRSLAGFKVPARFLVLEALPRNAMGKVERAVLRQRARNATAPMKQPERAAPQGLAGPAASLSGGPVQRGAPHEMVRHLPCNHVSLMAIDAIAVAATAVGSSASVTKLANLPTSIVPTVALSPSWTAG
jgi:O-succinylbenzoic acid--CoA ligase